MPNVFICVDELMHVIFSAGHTSPYCWYNNFVWFGEFVLSKTYLGNPENGLANQHRVVRVSVRGWVDKKKAWLVNCICHFILQYDMGFEIVFQGIN